MKDDNSKMNNPNSPFSNNPFLCKPLKRVNNPNSNNSNSSKSIEAQKDINKMNEHRASKFINLKNPKFPTHSEKKPMEPKNEKNTKNNNICIINSKGENDGTGFKKILNKFHPQEKNKLIFEKNEESKKQRKRASVERYLNPKIEERFKNELNLEDQKNFATNNSEHGDEKKENKKIQVTIKESLSKKWRKEKIEKDQNNLINNNPIDSNNNQIFEANNNKNENKKDDNSNDIISQKDDFLKFKNDDEILEYIKNKIKEGKLKNIYQKLDLKNGDFTGYSITKKEKGYTIYEINLEQDIKKVNEAIKKQKIEFNNKPIQLIYSEEYESLMKVKREYDCLKEVTYINVKNDYEKGEAFPKPKENINKPLENKNLKNENNKIKANNISVEGNFKLKEKEAEIKEKMTQKKPENENKFAGSNVISENDKKDKEALNQKKMSKALGRFKKAFSQHKDKDKESQKSGYTNKIQFFASMLKEHIMKPLSEIQEQKTDEVKINEGKIYKGASVECRKSKIVENNIVKIYENAPVTKKNFKKPKINNFVQ